MTETLELRKKIEELEQELEEERVRRKITEDYSDCAIWEYEIATNDMSYRKNSVVNGASPIW